MYQDLVYITEYYSLKFHKHGIDSWIVKDARINNWHFTILYIGLYVNEVEYFDWHAPAGSRWRSSKDLLTCFSWAKEEDLYEEGS